MTPDDLLSSADALMSRRDAATAGLWPRTAAMLIRMALEHSMRQFWQSRQIAMEGTSMAAQLIALPAFVDPVVARRLASTWGELSDACHHHPYELSPTTGQLRGWQSEVERAIQTLSGGGFHVHG